MDKANKEETRYQSLLDKAKREAEKAAGAKLDALNARIGELAQELLAAQEKSERAKSMAEQTKSGHVYIVSNIGSFGENLYKIGMTRRLEPMDRVKELGPALATHPAVLAMRARVFTAAGSRASAAEVAKRLVEFVPEDPHHWILLGDVTLLVHPPIVGCDILLP